MRRIHTAGPFTHLVGAALAAATFTVAGACVVACNGKNAANGADAAVDAEPAPSASSPAEALSAAPDAGGAAPSDAAAPPPVVHHRGLAGAFIRAALDTELTDDQKAAIDKLEEPAKNDPGTRREISAYHADLVASLKIGRFDGAKIQADEATFAKATQARQEEQATALNGLHETLTADQRKAVVEAIRTSQTAHEHPPTVSDAGASEGAARRLERMKSQLVLDLDQQKEVAAVLARSAQPVSAAQAHFDAMKKQMDTLLAAFEKDAFDARKLDLSATPGKKPTEALDRQVKYLEQLLPILTAGQRDRLAAAIERPREVRDHGRGDSIAEPADMAGGGMR